MIKEVTLHYPNGKKGTYEVGREVAGENIEVIEVEREKVIIFFKDDIKVISFETCKGGEMHERKEVDRSRT